MSPVSARLVQIAEPALSKRFFVLNLLSQHYLAYASKDSISESVLANHHFLVSTAFHDKFRYKKLDKESRSLRVILMHPKITHPNLIIKETSVGLYSDAKEWESYEKVTLR